MILRIKNPRIIVPEDSEGNLIDEQKYLAIELIDPLNPSMKPIKKNLFANVMPGFVEEWESWLPEDRGGSWASNDEEWNLKLVPKGLRFLKSAKIEQYDLGGDHFMIYSRDMNGHKEGEVVCDRNGNPKCYTSITVVTQVAYQMTPVLDPKTGEIQLDEDDNVLQKIDVDSEGRPIVTGYLPGWELDRLGAQDAQMYIPWSQLKKYMEDYEEEDEDLDDPDEEDPEDIEEPEEEEDAPPARTHRPGSSRR